MVYCIAILENELQRDNLAQCIKILGGEPRVHGNSVSVTAVHNESKLIELFEQYPQHYITAKEERGC